ncbi:MAG: GNAT family N-acetyltransferase [Paludibacteraceae bacterium]|nr:GNAT family N-acetyltransferase [Paludibacteraceae bacterium]
MVIINDTSKYGEECFICLENGICRLTLSPKCPDVAFLSTLIVDAKHRRKGTGNMLLVAAEKIAVEKGCNALTLESETGWTKDWYARHGFVVVGEGYDENMILMCKPLQNVQKRPKNKIKIATFEKK